MFHWLQKQLQESYNGIICTKMKKKMYKFNKKYLKIIRTRFLSVCMLVVLDTQNISFVGFANADFLPLFFVEIFSRKCKYSSKNAMEFKFFIGKCFLKFGDYISGRNLENTTLMRFQSKNKKISQYLIYWQNTSTTGFTPFFEVDFFEKNRIQAVKCSIIQIPLYCENL